MGLFIGKVRLLQQTETSKGSDIGHASNRHFTSTHSVRRNAPPLQQLTASIRVRRLSKRRSDNKNKMKSGRINCPERGIGM
jgi:hypothetical protein